MGLKVANGPVSWGVDMPGKAGVPPWTEVFEEMSQAGYRWCELGPLGYLPDDDAEVRTTLDALELGVAGSFVMEPMHDPARHDEIAAITHTTCSRIAGLGGEYLVVIEMVTEQRVATAGRSDAARRLEGSEYQDFLAGLRQVGAIAIEHDLIPVLHPHVGSHVEFIDEIERVLSDTADDGMQLCVDTGHIAYAGIEPVRFIAEHRDRCRYLHFKDVDPIVHQQVLREQIGFFDAIALGVFCPIGRGVVDFVALARELDNGFHGPGTVEQDRDLGSSTTALEDAVASLDYLRRLGLTD